MPIRGPSTGGVRAKRNNRIQFDFMLEGVRHRPTVRRTPTTQNLQAARERLTSIRQRIRAGAFHFDQEFPEYRFLGRVIDPSQVRTCNQVFDQFIAHCESRFRRDDLAWATVAGYRRVLNALWRPRIGALPFLRVDYVTLARVTDAYRCSRKTFNNAVSVLRRAFDFGYRNHPHHINPARGLRECRMSRKERIRPDPFGIDEAEQLIVAIRADWGEAQANYDEFRFFTGLRPSEQIALRISDFDAARRTLRVTKARVAGVRWAKTLSRLPVRPRRPYCGRHSSLSWNLMLGKNPLWVARQHGHSVRTMLEVYAAWADGAVESDLVAIRRSMGFRDDGVASDQPGLLRQLAGGSFGMPGRHRRQAPTSASGTGFGTRNAAPVRKPMTLQRERLAEREGFEPSKGF